MNKIREIIGKEYANTLGIIAYKNGEKVMEEYFEGAHENESVHTFSIVKSIVAVLVGVQAASAPISKRTIGKIAVSSKLLGYSKQIVWGSKSSIYRRKESGRSSVKSFSSAGIKISRRKATVSRFIASLS